MAPFARLWECPSRNRTLKRCYRALAPATREAPRSRLNVILGQQRTQFRGPCSRGQDAGVHFAKSFAWLGLPVALSALPDGPEALASRPGDTFAAAFPVRDPGSECLAGFAADGRKALPEPDAARNGSADLAASVLPPLRGSLLVPGMRRIVCPCAIDARTVRRGFDATRHRRVSQIMSLNADNIPSYRARVHKRVMRNHGCGVAIHVSDV